MELELYLQKLYKTRIPLDGNDHLTKQSYPSESTPNPSHQLV